MNSLLESLQISSYLEFAILILIFVAPYLVNIAYTYWKTKDSRTVPIQIFSLIITNLLLALGIFLLKEIPFLQYSNKIWVSVAIANIVNMANLMIITTEYLRERKNKNLDEDRINRNHFASTLNTFIVLLIIAISFSLFLNKELISLVLLATLPASISIWINHLFARRQLVDDNEY